MPCRTPRTAQPHPTVWLFRAVVSVHAAMLVTQPFLAGRFLSGEFAMLKVHAIVGGLLMPAGMGLIVAAVLLWRPGRGPAWPIVVAISITMATAIQLGAGYTRDLGLHVPLGVGLVAAGVYLAVWAWSPHRTRNPASPPPLAAQTLPPAAVHTHADGVR